MPQIVSGLDPKARMEAYLAGQQSQRQLMAQQQAAKEHEQARQDRMHQEILKAMHSHKTEQAKALAATNAKAQMGDAMALQQQNMEAEAAKVPPQQQRLKEMAGILSKIEDPKARAFAAKEFEGYHKKLQDEEERQAAMSVIETSAADGHLDGEAMKARMDAGEDPRVIAREAQKERAKRADEAMNIQESTDALAQAEALLQSAPRGSASQKRAMHFIQLFKDSPTQQKQRGAGPSLLKHVKDALILSKDEEVQMRTQRLQSHMPGLGGMSMEAMKGELENEPTLGFGGPDIPKPTEDLGTHATLRGSNRLYGPPRAPKNGKSLKKQSAPADAQSAAQAVIAEMRANGIPITPDNLQAVKARLRGQGASAAGTQ